MASFRYVLLPGMSAWSLIHYAAAVQPKCPAPPPPPPPPGFRPNHQAVGGTSDGPTGLQARQEGKAPGVSPVWHR